MHDVGACVEMSVAKEHRRPAYGCVSFVLGDPIERVVEWAHKRGGFFTPSRLRRWFRFAATQEACEQVLADLHQRGLLQAPIVQTAGGRVSVTHVLVGYDREAIRNLGNHEDTPMRYYPALAQPTAATPGSPEKLAVMQRRLAAGMPLFVTGDAVRMAGAGESLE